MADEGELDLRSLNDDELVQQMHDDLYDGLKDEVVEGVNILLERKWTPYDTLTKGLVEGMRIVGIDFRDGILFVPEVLLAANAMMMEGAGFEVINLGINNPVENYLKAIDEHAPDILGMSALLTTTMPYMKVVIDALVEKGIRNDYVVLV